MITDQSLMNVLFRYWERYSESEWMTSCEGKTKSEKTWFQGKEVMCNEPLRFLQESELFCIPKKEGEMEHLYLGCMKAFDLHHIEG